MRKRISIIISLVILALAIVAGSSMAIAKYLHQNSGPVKIYLSAADELDVLHTVQAEDEAKQVLQGIDQKYKGEAEADPEYRAARDKAESATRELQAAGAKYVKKQESDVEFKAAKKRYELRVKSRQDRVTALLEAHKCKDCAIDQDKLDYRLYLTNAPAETPKNAPAK